MRWGLLPPPLRATNSRMSPPQTSTCPSHWVVTASESTFAAIRRYVTESTHRQGGSGPWLTAHLPPECWSGVLRLCQLLTVPEKSYTFSSPGLSTAVTSTSGKQLQEAQAVCLHIVEREAEDFVPNNMIYNTLQQASFLPIPLPSSSAGPAASFAAYLKDLQCGRVGEGVSPVTLRHSTAAVPEPRHSLSGDAKAVECSAKNVSLAALPLPSSPDVQKFFFFPYPVDVWSSIPYRSPFFSVLVNLKPIVPHHLMIVPHRCVGSLQGLRQEEVEDFGRVMALAVRVLNRVRGSERSAVVEEDILSNENYSVAIQQGSLAGQTVAHLHVHLIPFDPRGKLAQTPEADEEEQRRRPPRTAAEMAAESAALRPLFEEEAAKRVWGCASQKPAANKLVEMKQQLRIRMLSDARHRAKVNPKAVAETSKELCDHLYRFLDALLSPKNSDSRSTSSSEDSEHDLPPLHVCVYWPLYYEVSLVPLVERLWAWNKALMESGRFPFPGLQTTTLSESDDLLPSGPPTDPPSPPHRSRPVSFEDLSGTLEDEADSAGRWTPEQQQSGEGGKDEKQRSSTGSKGKTRGGGRRPPPSREVVVFVSVILTPNLIASISRTMWGGTSLPLHTLNSFDSRNSCSSTLLSTSSFALGGHHLSANKNLNSNPNAVSHTTTISCTKEGAAGSNSIGSMNNSKTPTMKLTYNSSSTNDVTASVRSFFPPLHHHSSSSGSSGFPSSVLTGPPLPPSLHAAAAATSNGVGGVSSARSQPTPPTLLRSPSTTNMGNHLQPTSISAVTSSSGAPSNNSAGQATANNSNNTSHSNVSNASSVPACPTSSARLLGRQNTNNFPSFVTDISGAGDSGAFQRSQESLGSMVHACPAAPPLSAHQRAMIQVEVFDQEDLDQNFSVQGVHKLLTIKPEVLCRALLGEEETYFPLQHPLHPLHHPQHTPVSVDENLPNNHANPSRHTNASSDNSNGSSSLGKGGHEVPPLPPPPLGGSPLPTTTSSHPSPPSSAQPPHSRRFSGSPTPIPGVVDRDGSPLFFVSRSASTGESPHPPTNSAASASPPRLQRHTTSFCSFPQFAKGSPTFGYPEGATWGWNTGRVKTNATPQPPFSSVVSSVVGTTGLNVHHDNSSAPVFAAAPSDGSGLNSPRGARQERPRSRTLHLNPPSQLPPLSGGHTNDSSSNNTLSTGGSVSALLPGLGSPATPGVLSAGGSSSFQKLSVGEAAERAPHHRQRRFILCDRWEALFPNCRPPAGVVPVSGEGESDEETETANNAMLLKNGSRANHQPSRTSSGSTESVGEETKERSPSDGRSSPLREPNLAILPTSTSTAWSSSPLPLAMETEKETTAAQVSTKRDGPKNLNHHSRFAESTEHGTEWNVSADPSPAAERSTAPYPRDRPQTPPSTPITACRADDNTRQSTSFEPHSSPVLSHTSPPSYGLGSKVNDTEAGAEDLMHVGEMSGVIRPSGPIASTQTRPDDPKPLKFGLGNVSLVVLTPGVAFTPEGERLGKGGGYYDRFLSFVTCCRSRIAPPYSAGYHLHMAADDDDDLLEPVARVRSNHPLVSDKYSSSAERERKGDPRSHRRQLRCVAVGVGFDYQMRSTLPLDDKMDVKLSAVACPSSGLTFYK